MSELILGEFWESASRVRQERFRDAFRSYIVEHLLDKIDADVEVSFVVKDAVMLNQRDARVTTSVVSYGMEVAEIAWTVRDRGSDLKIFDIVRGGVSLVRTFRSEFRSYVAQKGMDELVMVLVRKTASR